MLRNFHSPSLDAFNDPLAWLMYADWRWQLGAAVAVFYLVMMLVLRIRHAGSASQSTGKVRAPGYWARRRARKGIKHPKAGVGLGYAGALATAGLAWAEFRLGGLVFGAPGSGKTNSLQLIIQAAAAAGSAAVIIDPKGSRDLRRTVAALGGRVWTIGGAERWSPLEDDPEVMAEQLMEGEQVDPRAPRVFNQGARLAAQQLGRALHQSGQRPDIRQVVDLLRSDKWSTLVRLTLGPEYIPLTDVERSGVQTFAAGLSGLLLGPAGRSLGSDKGCFRLRETVAAGQIVLFSLDGNSFPDTTRRLAGWAFLSVRALLSERLDKPGPMCIVVADEAHRVGWTGRLAVDLLAVGREAGVPVILASQGPSDLDDLGHHLLERSVQDAAWTLVFRQGTLDSSRSSRILGVKPAVERTTGTVGYTQRAVEAYGQAGASVGERACVPPSALEVLQQGDAWLRVPPVLRREARVQCIRVAMREPALVLPGPAATEPLSPGTSSETLLGTSMSEPSIEIPADVPTASLMSPERAEAWAYVQALIVERGEDQCWPIVFPEGVKGTDSSGYPRIKVKVPGQINGKYVKTYQLAYEAHYGHEATVSVEHICRNKMCHNWRHLEDLTLEEQSRRRQRYAKLRAIERANEAKGVVDGDAAG